jgi:hypothetical protein
LENAFEALADIDIQYDGAVGAPLPSGAAAPMANAGADNTNQAFQQILAVVTHLADKLEVTQQQVNALSASGMRSAAPESTSAQGAIPKQRCMPMSATSASTLDDLRADDQLAARANHMVDSLDGLQGQGNNRVSGASTKRGWARPGGDNAPRICVPWPQDYVIGHGRRNRLLYDDLDIYQFIQGAIAIIEQQDELSLIKLMLAQLRATMRDASFHGYEPARYSYGIVLSMLEDGALTWQDQYAWRKSGGQL